MVAADCVRNASAKSAVEERPLSGAARAAPIAASEGVRACFVVRPKAPRLRLTARVGAGELYSKRAKRRLGATALPFAQPQFER